MESHFPIVACDTFEMFMKISILLSVLLGECTEHFGKFQIVISISENIYLKSTFHGRLAIPWIPNSIFIQIFRRNTE